MKLPHRRKFLHLAVGAAALPAVPRFAWGQSYPSRPVRIVVTFPAGSTSDILARPLAQWLQERLGQPFVIDNRPGAGGNIGTEAVINAPSDGYTLLLVPLSSAINATLYDKLNFNFIRDIAPVASYQPQRHGHGYASFGPSQNDYRVDRVRQGQSRQAQHGVGWHRDPATWLANCSS